jgi:hypothetical protein
VTLPFTIDLFPGAAEVFGRGTTFLDRFDLDKYSEERKANLFYPFASKQDWEVASWLSRSGLSMASIDKFLSLELVSLNFYSLYVLIYSDVFSDTDTPTFFSYCQRTTAPY